MKIPVSTALTLREAADANAGGALPFCWFPSSERDQMKPLLAKLKLEYVERGAPFLLRGVSQGGIYPPEAHWLMCKTEDQWIRKHLAELIAISDVLPEAQIQIYHVGCQGDILAAGPIFRALGKVHLKIGNFQEPKWQHRNMEGDRFDAIRHLLEIQPYIASVTFEHGANHSLELEHWRVKHQKGRTLTECQADYLGIQNVDMSPWIENVVPSPETAGMVVIARTARYHNPNFPWQGILNHEYYAGKFVFIGLLEEHTAFCQDVGTNVPYRPTANLLEVAELIAGSALFIGNQSSPCWIAMGLGHRLIQEVSPEVQDSMVVRPNAQFVLLGNIEIRPL